jgi:hypothetical protein
MVARTCRNAAIPFFGIRELSKLIGEEQMRDLFSAPRN